MRRNQDEIEFALYLMRHMRGRDAIARTLTSLGLGADDLDAAAARVASSVDFYDLRRHTFDTYVKRIGPPIASAPDPACSDSDAFAGSFCHRFHLEVWRRG